MNHHEDTKARRCCSADERPNAKTHIQFLIGAVAFEGGRTFVSSRLRGDSVFCAVNSRREEYHMMKVTL
jgi:hypothetical protein